jgi:hypothetical protein
VILGSALSGRQERRVVVGGDVALVNTGRHRARVPSGSGVMPIISSRRERFGYSNRNPC